MDQKLLREREAKCVQDNPPGCTAGCPVHVDARGIIHCVRKEDYNTGFALFHKTIPFPGIISRICDQPCQQQCKRREIDEAIVVRALEKLCVDQYSTQPKLTAPRPKSQRVAIVGAGLSGLTAAYELSRKGYQLTVFEATDRLGGAIWNFPETQLPRRAINDDFAVFTNLPAFEICYHTVITSLDSLTGFDAVYLGTGCAQAATGFGLEQHADGTIAIDAFTLATSCRQVFAGGSLRRPLDDYSPITSVADGKKAANSLDRFLQNASLTANRVGEDAYATELYTNIDNVKPSARITAANPASGYTTAEALEEAGRCLLCECLECVKVCEYLAHFRSYPKRYVREVYNNLSIVMGIHHANKLINACSLCGLCEEVCPRKLSMAQICQQARQMMVEKNKMPPSVHDFALRDMQFSTSDAFSLARHQPNHSTSAAVFYPGCQLAASAPEQVKAMYRFLGEKLSGGVGLMLGCCGAPASWSGREALFAETLQQLEAEWRSLGSPKIITACPTCYSLLKQHAPALPVESLWTLLTKIGLPPTAKAAQGAQTLAVHDSCTTRYDAELQTSVRTILAQLGYTIEELPLRRETTVCCGYGGLMLYANKEITHKVIHRRIQESACDYLTYCAMCRDNFAGQGKTAYHLLDLLFGKTADTAGKPGPGLSARQENRAKLKTAVLRELWGEEVNQPAVAINAIIPPEVLQRMEERQILVDDVTQVIAYAEKSGNRLQHENGYYIAYLQPASVTYWVEYEPQADGFIVHNAYCHRITITG